PLMLPPGWETKYDPQKMRLPANFLPVHPFDHGNFDGRDEKLFLWPRTPQETRREIAAYYAVISYMDEQIGRIMAALNASGKADNTVVIFSSDHGLSVGSHGLRGKQSMYEHTIGVPLLLLGPGVPKGQRFDAQCYLRDLFPTLCDLAGIDDPGEQIDGRSLKPVLDEETEKVHDFVVGYFRDFQRMIRTDDWKYIEYPAVDRQQLFHLKHDPHERTNLIAVEAHAAVREHLKTQMRDWFRNQGDSVYVGLDNEE
ncbi:MAG: sulfatase-like hydrolase/transferase, partial [Fuerstiella sp.]